MRERIATLLSTGLKPSQVSTIVGLSPGRISQITSEESFQLLLASKQEELKEKDVEEESISAKYSAAEHALIQQVMDMAPVSELRDVTAALRVVSERQEKMKSRTTVQVPHLSQTLNVVSITLPSHVLVAPKVQQNSQREIIAIDNNTLAPLPSQSVTTLFSQMREQKGEYHEPSPSTDSTEASPSVASSSAQSSPEPSLQSFLEYAGA